MKIKKYILKMKKGGKEVGRRRMEERSKRR
jgi:hypothetical protein